MLSDKVIIYDDSCPMCKLYTYWFVAWGFLRPENRIGFATAPDSITTHVDLKRGRHEIPLYDRSTRKTIYGLDALTFVLGSRWTWLKPVFKSKAFYRLLHPVYEIITYNRRVIAGCKASCGFDCAPDLNRFYRSVYLGIAGAIVTAVTLALMTFAAKPMMAVTLIVGLIACGILGGVVTRARSGALATWNFAGNYATVLLMAAIALTPMLIIPHLNESFSWTNVGLATVLAMWETHRRRLLR